MKMASSSTTLAAISGCQGLSLHPQEPQRVSGPSFPEGSRGSHLLPQLV
jgi:hypothetical protein